MAPPGVNTCFENLDSAALSSFYAPVVTVMKPKTSPTSSPSLTLPSTLSLAEITWGSTQTDDHVMTPQSFLGYVDSTSHTCELSVNCDESGFNDAMLSSCLVDTERVVGDIADTDFLRELDDLNFNLEDLDPCCEVAMEDSFQEFIDAALEESYSTCLQNTSADNEDPTGQDAEIFSKEQFLATLDLRPVQDDKASDYFRSVSSTSVAAESSPNGRQCVSDQTASKITTQTSSAHFNTAGVTSHEQVPTRQCSGLGFENQFKVVYSMAHPTNQECVQICASSRLSSPKSDDCTDCFQKRLTPDVRMSPLFTDTSSREKSHLFQSSPIDYAEVATEEYTQQRTESDSTDIMMWLHEGQQECQQEYTGNTDTHRVHIDESSAKAEMSNPSTAIDSSLDFESYVNLEDFEMQAPDTEIFEDTHHQCQKTPDHSKYSCSTLCVSQLKLSLFTERDGLGRQLMQDYSNAYHEIPKSEYVNSSSSDLFSPSLSISDSSQSSLSPVHLRNMHLSFSSNEDDDIYGSTVKSPLALLDLFSDENATSLLHTDSTVPSIRFM